jgi:hypothetical protein
MLLKLASDEKIAPVKSTIFENAELKRIFGKMNPLKSIAFEEEAVSESNNVPNLSLKILSILSPSPI